MAMDGTPPSPAVQPSKSQDGPPMFSLRVVNLEYYLSPPLPGLDVCYSKFQGRTVNEVPVVRIYGATPAGQKACLHLHQVFPYFYVPYDDDLPQDISDALAYVRCLASAIEKAMKLASSNAAKKQHVHSCSLVRARRYYGYYPSEQLFIKVVLYHPQEVARISTLLLGGGIMNRKFQPHESHISYLLQLLIDQNLAGMSFIHLSSVKFRRPVPERPSDTLHVIQQLKTEFNPASQQTAIPTGVNRRASQTKETSSMETTPPTTEWAGSGPESKTQSHVWLGSSIPAHWIWPSHYSTGGPFGRHSTCELEVDASVEDVLNRQELVFMPLHEAGLATKLVQSLTPMWEEERLRTGEKGPAGVTNAGRPSPDRFLPPPSALEQALRDSLFQIVQEEDGVRHFELRNEQFLKSTQEMLLEGTQAANSVKPQVGVQELDPRLDTNSIGVQEWLHGEDGVSSGEKSVMGSQNELVNEDVIRSQLTPQEAEQEVAELLEWMGASQEEHDMGDSGDEVDEEILEIRRCFSQTWESPSMEAAMLQALSRFEQATQKECQEILDCVNNDECDEGDGDEDLEAALLEIDLEEVAIVRRGRTGRGGTIPQIDGASDACGSLSPDGDLFHRYSQHLNTLKTRGATKYPQGNFHNTVQKNQQHFPRIPQNDGADDDDTESDFAPEPKRIRLGSHRSSKDSQKSEKDVSKRPLWGSLPLVGVPSTPSTVKLEKMEPRVTKREAPSGRDGASLRKQSTRVAEAAAGRGQRTDASLDEKAKGSEVSLRALMRRKRERQLRSNKDSSISGGSSIVGSQSEGEQSFGGMGLAKSQGSIPDDSESQEIKGNKQDVVLSGQIVASDQGITKPRNVRQTLIPLAIRQVNKGAVQIARSSQDVNIGSECEATLQQRIGTGSVNPVEDVLDSRSLDQRLETNPSPVKIENSLRKGDGLLETGDDRDCGGGRNPRTQNPGGSDCIQVQSQAVEDEDCLGEEVPLTQTKKSKDYLRGSSPDLADEEDGMVQTGSLDVLDGADVHDDIIFEEGARLAWAEVVKEISATSLTFQNSQVSNFDVNEVEVEVEDLEQENHFVETQLLEHEISWRMKREAIQRDVEMEPDAFEDEYLGTILVQERDDVIVDLSQANASVNMNSVLVPSKTESPDQKELNETPPKLGRNDHDDLDLNEKGTEAADLLFTDMPDVSEDSFDWGDEFGSAHRLDTSDEGAEASDEEDMQARLPNINPELSTRADEVAPLRRGDGMLRIEGIQLPLPSDVGPRIVQSASPQDALLNGQANINLSVEVPEVPQPPAVTEQTVPQVCTGEGGTQRTGRLVDGPDVAEVQKCNLLSPTVAKPEAYDFADETNGRASNTDAKGIEHEAVVEVATSKGKNSSPQPRECGAQGMEIETSIPVRFHQKPPSRDALMDSLGQYNLRGVDYGGVFYGNSKDVPGRPTVSAGLIFDVKSKDALDLPPFLFGAENKKSRYSNSRAELKSKPADLRPGMGVPCHFENDGSVSYLLTPARPPPTRLAVQQWLSKNHGTDGEKHSTSRGERVFTMDANTGKLVPIDEARSDRSTQESLPGEEDVEFFRPASPKYDEKHVLATPMVSDLPGSQEYVRVSRSNRRSSYTDSQKTPVSKSPHSNPPVSSGATTPVNTQKSRDGEPEPKLLQTSVQNRTAVTAQASLGRRMDPPPPVLKGAVKEEVSKAKQSAGTSKDVPKSALRWRDVSQITAPSPLKGQLTPLSQSGFRDPASVGAGQQITLMSIEVHSETRGNLRPDPRYDAVGMVVVDIQYDDETRGHFNNQTLVLLVDAKASSSSKNVDGVTGCCIIYLADELTLLKCFVRLVRLCDPDMLVGWEVQGSSLGLLAERAANLGLGLLKELSRTPPKAQTQIPKPDAPVDANSGDDHHSGDDLPKAQELRNSVFSEMVPLETGMADSVIADEWGRTHGSGLFVGGRIVLNLWRIMRGEVKLGIYTLEAVAEAVLRRRVPRIPWRSLTRWFARGPAQGRHRCINYFVDRAKLNFEIMDQLDLLNRTAELARVFGIDFYSVFSRGSQYRVESMMLRLAHTQNFLLLSPSRQQVAGQPAMGCLPLVMEPESRFYTSPVVVLDFQSLYPSMIIAYNLCFSTCLGKIVSNNPKVLGVSNLPIPPGLLQELKDFLTITPNGVMYTPPEVRQGVVPRLLSEILSTRIMVKQAMKKLSSDQKVLQRVLNARQFALKLIANVTYGYTAAGFSGRMPCAELADSIVQCGRLTLERAIHLVNTTKRWDARVVYGDTDSMFVHLEGRTREEAFKIGQEIAASVTAVNPNPVTLKMEKVYHPCVLLTKKRYVGYSYESPSQLHPTFDAKGIETIRRDSCAAVAKTLERSLRTLFETQDLSQVKAYLQRQWGKIVSGRISLRDFVFAKEVRLGTYSARASVLPAAAIVASKAMSLDPRAEPRYAERIPYVVVHGEPGARLSDVVVDPNVMLANGLRLHDTYYITKQIIPALQRVFGLVGADLRQWYAELPRVYRPPTSKRAGKITTSNAGTEAERGSKGGLVKGTIDHYYLSQHCSVCGELMRGSQLICSSCVANPQAVVSVLTTQTAQLEKEFKHLEAICRHCGGGDGGPEGHISCVSLDCPIFFERLKVQKELQALSTVSANCGYYPTCFLDFGSELF